MNAYKILPLALVACVSIFSSAEQLVAIANPASEFCATLGGQLRIQKDSADNEHGICTHDGFEVEEWELFRHHQNTNNELVLLNSELR